MKAIGRPDLADDPRLKHNAGRWQHVDELDAAIGEWCARHTAAEVVAVLDEAGVPANTIYSAADIVADPLFHARGMLQRVPVPGLDRPLLMPGVVPKLSETPGGTEWAGPALGAHNREVYCGLLGLKESELAALQNRGII
jgi:crotonobetainyl-CoA:carnitine CoA-transferase CaiB-like acyl-CoA transferase